MKNKIVKIVTDYLFIAAGAIISAAGYSSFLIPNDIAAGGATGLATIFNYFIPILPVGAMTFAINIPLLFILFKDRGIGAVVRVAFGTLVFSVALDVVAAFVPTWTSDAFLACIYGGLLAGFGGGIIFRFRGGTGGTGLMAKLINARTGQPVGRLMIIVDAVVIAAAALIFSVESALYAMIAVYITGKVVDVMEEGISYNKSVWIFCSDPEKMARILIEEVSRGVTSFPCKGMYTGGERAALLCVVAQGELSQLRAVVYKHEPNAFLVVGNCNEVLGQGFVGLKEKVVD